MRTTDERFADSLRMLEESTRQLDDWLLAVRRRLDALEERVAVLEGRR